MLAIKNEIQMGYDNWKKIFNSSGQDSLRSKTQSDDISFAKAPNNSTCIYSHTHLFIQLNVNKYLLSADHVLETVLRAGDSSITIIPALVKLIFWGRETGNKLNI